jgi:limonene-1,2-epoxide hydrolase
VVERFLDLLAAADIECALRLVAADIEYENVSLPTAHGRERMRRLFGTGYERGGGSRSACTPSQLMAQPC